MESVSAKVVYGVCGIGNGHTLRAAPIIEQLLERGCMVAVLAYKASFSYFSKLYADNQRVKVVPVSVPYFVGSSEGLNFSASLDILSSGDGVGSTLANMHALSELQKWLGKPNLVLSDYEPVSAQYAYAYDAPLVTIDQQSKFLLGCFKEQLSGLSSADEAARLRMFFPKAEKRLICSFYRCLGADPSEAERAGVYWCPAPISQQVKGLVREAREDGRPKRMLGYISAQAGSEYSQERFVRQCALLSDIEWDLFFPSDIQEHDLPSNVRCHPHGSEAFLGALTHCDGIVANAGHSLLAEAMYLAIPVLALPLMLYEQQLNAQMISANGFGILASEFNANIAKEFVDKLDVFQEAIAKDAKVLVRGDGVASVMADIAAYLE
jgi:uncharacterized protein (TIGR00661 family)